MNSDQSVPPAKSLIYVTPFIDVLLVMLIFFVGLTPPRPARFKVLLPEEPRPVEPPRRPNPLTLVVVVDSSHRLSVNGGETVGTTADPSGLVRLLAEVFEKRRRERVLRHDVVDLASLPEEQRIERTVFVKAPRSIRYGEVARVIDAVKGAGAHPIALQLDGLEP